jgi:Zn-dependent peptidase ImmA (M78 family)
MIQLNPKILEWARVTSGRSLDEAAQVLGMASVDRLKAIESGEVAPTRPLLLKMAKQYHRSLLTLYLSEPPKQGDRGQDFRMLPAKQSSEGSALLDALIRDLKMRQSLVKAALVDDDHPALDFIGTVEANEGAPALLGAVQKTLAIDLAKFRAARSTEEAFAYLRGRAEEKGIFVLLVGNLGSHHTNISVEAFRGFAIADPIAPFVAINDQDAKTAWSFTLLHEVAHLFLGTTGLSGSGEGLAIERLCNDVAGELLLPRAELQLFQSVNLTDIERVTSEISAFASVRHISRQMVAYKLFRTGAIKQEFWRSLDGRFREMWQQEKARSKEARKGTKDAGPDYYVVRRHRLGGALIEFANRGVNAGSLSPAKAAKILGVKPRSVYPLLAATPKSGTRSAGGN